jgi:hypothetical protein
MDSVISGESAVLAEDVHPRAWIRAGGRRLGGTPLATRALRSLAGVFVLTWAFRISGYGTFASWSAVPVVLLGLLGLLVIVAAWLPTSVVSEHRQHLIGWGALAAIIAALTIWSYFQVFTAPDYGTDEIAFDQYAAQLALHGINPYLHSMAPAFPLFHVSPNGYTFQLNGQPVTALSYPALAFEEGCGRGRRRRGRSGRRPFHALPERYPLHMVLATVILARSSSPRRNSARRSSRSGRQQNRLRLREQGRQCQW